MEKVRAKTLASGLIGDYLVSCFRGRVTIRTPFI